MLNQNIVVPDHRQWLQQSSPDSALPRKSSWHNRWSARFGQWQGRDVQTSLALEIAKVLAGGGVLDCCPLVVERDCAAGVTDLTD